jgi:hypothetical protein
MYKPGKRAAAFAPALALTLAAMLAPTIASAGVALDAGPAQAAGAKPAPHAAGPWQIRCWQDGRLLFEENGISLPDGAQYPTVITGADRQGRPVYVAETRNATCLIRQAVADRGAWPR